MGLFDHFPYTNVHELNLDWVLSMMKALEAEWEAFTAGNSLTFADPLQHDSSKTYAKNTIVLDANGNAYVSLQPVPVGVALSNQDYWLMVFDYEAFIEKVNKNFTARYYRGQYRATAAMVIGDWLTVDDVLCKATAAIAADDVLEVGVNIEHFTLEDFIKAFMTSANQMIQQYKNDIDASELAYKNQLAHDIQVTTQSLQAQLDAVIAGATVDSEVIDARVGWNGVTYASLGTAIRTQFSDLNSDLRDAISTDSELLYNLLNNSVIDRQTLPYTYDYTDKAVTTGLSGVTVYTKVGSKCRVWDVSAYIGKNIFVATDKDASETIALVIGDASNQVVLSESKSGANYNKYFIVPNDSKLLYVNYVSSASLVIDDVERVHEVCNEMEITRNISPLSTYANLIASYNANGHITTTSATGCNCALFIVQEIAGEVLNITLDKYTNNNVYAVIGDMNNDLVWAGYTNNNSVSGIQIKIPDNAVRLYINYITSYDISYTSIKEVETFDKRVTPLMTYDNTYVSYGGGGTATVSMTGNKYHLYDVKALRGKKIKVTSDLISSSYSLLCFFLLEDLTTVSGAVNDSTTLLYADYEISVPATARYLYMNSIMPFDAKVEIVDDLPMSDISNITNKKIQGKKCTCFGTSITWYNGHPYTWGTEYRYFAIGYPHYMEEAGMIVDNQGYDGGTIRNIVNERVLNYDFSTTDYVTIGAGANDARHGIPVGSLQTDNFDNTFTGRLQAAIEYMLSSNPHLKILLLTPIRGWIFAPDGYAYPRAIDGIVDPEYAEAIKEVATYYGLPVCDLYNTCGFNEFTRDVMYNDPTISDGNNLYILHPSAEGYKRMADIIIPALNAI